MKVENSPRLAVIGCGAVVDYHLLPALRRIGWLPTVLVDTVPARLDVVARRMGGKGRAVLKASDWQSVADQFDAAVVAVPHALHGPVGLSLLKAKKHLFMEKPLAIRSDECAAMIQTAEANRLTLSVGLLRRYLHISRWTKALLESGVLGSVRRFHVREGFLFNWATSSDGLLRPEMAGGGVLMDTGAHTLDQVLWWLGDVASLDYRDDSEGGVEADCAIDVVLKSGATGRIELSRCREMSNTIRIDGTQGFVELQMYKNEVVAGSPNALAFVNDGIGATNMPQQLFPELFDKELSDFRTAASGTAKVGIGGREGARSVDLIERCYRARRPLAMPWAEADPVPAAQAKKPRIELPAGSLVVVTGATGFIGGRLVERLLHESGARVRCIVREIGSAMRLARLPVEIVKADLADAAAVDKAVTGADYVFHCAYDTRSIRQNMDAARNLIDSCVKHSVKRLVHTSTISVYEPFPDGPLTEESPDGDRKWVYTNTKLDIEKEMFEATKSRGLRATVVQPTIVYGPFCKPWTNLPAERLILGNVILPDEGQGLCNAVYIDDLVDGMILSATQEAAIGQRFLISGPEPVTWATFYSDFAHALNVKPPAYWPSAKISEKNHGLMRDIRLVVSNPKRIVQIIVRWQPARQALQSGLDAMPKPIKDLVNKYYFGAPQRILGEDYLPDPQALALYRSKAAVHSEKARQLLGYEPRYDFERGMDVTKRYLEWSYGDLRRSVVKPASPPKSDGNDITVLADRAHAR